LVGSGLLARGGARGALALTPAGETALDAIVRNLRAQEAMYLRHLAKPEVVIWMKVVDQIAANAEALLSPDQSRWLEVQRVARLERVRAREASGELAVTRVLAVIRLINRVMFPRLKAIGRRPPLEVLAFSRIAELAPVSLAGLIAHMQRDKAQVGRIVKSLVEGGLVRRDRAPGSRDTVLAPTPGGDRLQALLTEDAFALNAILLNGVTEDDYAVFVDVLDRMAAGAQQLLAYEEALVAAPAVAGPA